MRTRTLGRTGFSVSEIGLGTWGLGGVQWRDMEPRDAQRAVYLALESGMSFLDTALAYGDGASETLIGQAVRELRARDWAMVATKVPPVRGSWLSGAGTGSLRDSFPAQHVARSVEQSLRNLRAEVLGLALLHVWRDAWLDESSWPEVHGTMLRMVREGKVLHWGVALDARTHEDELRILDEPAIAAIEVTYNIFEQSAGRVLLGRAHERGLGVIARAPLDEGALTGRLTPETRFAPDDVRSSYFQGNRLAQAVERVARLRPLLGDEARTLAELALRFCTSHPAVSTVIPGMRRAEHVHHNLAVSDGRLLSENLRERLREHAWDRSWYVEESAAVP